MNTATIEPVEEFSAGSETIGSKHPGAWTVFRWEMRKLAAQARTRYSLLLALVGPAVVVVVLNGQQNPPKDTLYGRYIHTSGYAMPLLVLGFAAQWIFPLLTSIVAGDIFASEDQHGTWKTILTRSVSRRSLFWGKTLAASAFAAASLFLFAASTIISSMVVVGTQPLEGLTGQLIPGSTALWLVLASWALMLAPLLGFTALAILLSVKTRNPAVGVAAPLILGFCMQLLGAIGNVDLLRRVLLTTPFESWHGLFAQHRFYDLIISGLVVSACWAGACLTAAYASLRRRDITGG